MVTRKEPTRTCEPRKPKTACTSTQRRSHSVNAASEALYPSAQHFRRFASGLRDRPSGFRGKLMKWLPLLHARSLISTCRCLAIWIELQVPRKRFFIQTASSSSPIDASPTIPSSETANVPPNLAGLLPIRKEPCISSFFASKAANTASAAPSMAEKGVRVPPDGVRHHPAHAKRCRSVLLFMCAN